MVVLFCRSQDPLFHIATPLRPHELNTYSTKSLTPYSAVQNVTSQDSSSSFESHSTDDYNGEVKTEQIQSQLSVDDTEDRPSCPGWYGKGYGKPKRPTKKRKMR